MVGNRIFLAKNKEKKIKITVQALIIIDYCTVLCDALFFQRIIGLLIQPFW